jgi:hypothetical protein
LPVPPLLEVTLLVVLFCIPGAMPVTFTLNVAEEVAGNAMPDTLMTFVPGVAVIVPFPNQLARPFLPSQRTARESGDRSGYASHKRRRIHANRDQTPTVIARMNSSNSRGNA